MLAWHLAAAVFLFRWIFRDPKVDLRFLAAGAVLPDVLDLAVVTVMGGETGELWGHSLALPSLIGVGVLIATRRGRRRRAWMALVAGWLFHLLIDGMWTDTEVFLWPAFGIGLAEGGARFWPRAWERAVSDPWRWVAEMIGVVYLWWLAGRAGLSRSEARRRFLQTGRIEEPVPPNYRS